MVHYSPNAQKEVPEETAEYCEFDLSEPLSEELSIKIQPSLLIALKSKVQGRLDGKHDFSKHVRRVLAEWIMTDKADCFDCVFGKPDARTSQNIGGNSGVSPN